MIKFNLAKMIGMAFVLSAATSTVALAQTFKVLASFDGTDGGQTSAGLAQGTDGNFYGTSPFGGGNSNCGSGCGTIFKITPAGKLTAVYSFCPQTGCTDGATPHAALVLATDGSFYGTTAEGGTSSNCGGGCGTVFKVTAAGKLTTLYSFCPQTGCTDGADPYAGLVQGTDGNFYGTSQGGGASSNCNGGCGTVFKITAAGKLTTLYSFCPQTGCPDGYSPRAGLVQGVDGNFYGTTYYGGSNSNKLCDLNGNGCGTIFKITMAGTLTTLHSFCPQTGCADGANPQAGLIQGSDGGFYGTTVYGGPNNCGSGCGTALKITSTGKLTTLYSFCTQNNCADGSNPYAALVQGSDKNFYGTTWFGEASLSGTIFKITAPGKLTTLYGFCPQTGCPDGEFPMAELVQGTDGSFYGTASAGGAKNGWGTVFSLSTGVRAFVAFVNDSGKVGTKVEILGQGFKGTTGVSFNGTGAKFAVRSDTYLTATVPSRSTSGFVTVTTPKGKLRSNKKFHVIR